MKKRVLSLLLASIMFVNCLTGCGKNDSNSNKNNGQDQVVQNSQKESQTETESEKESEVEISPEQKWYNSAESNGLNFSLTQACLDAYLDYVVSEDATEDYANFFMKTNYYELDKKQPETPVYFTIAGMDKSEPYLLMSTVNTSQSDLIMFKTCVDGRVFAFEEFRPDRYSSENTYNHYTATLYAVSEEPAAPNTRFIEMVTDRYVDRYGSTTMQYYMYEWIYDSNGKMWNAKLNEIRANEGVEERAVKSKTVSELKWFHVSQLEAAKKYYSQFVKESGTMPNTDFKLVSKDITISANEATKDSSLCKNPYICLLSYEMDASVLPKEKQMPFDTIQDEINKKMSERDYVDDNGEWSSKEIVDYLKGELGVDLEIKKSTGRDSMIKSIVVGNTTPYKWEGYDGYFEATVTYYVGQTNMVKHPEEDRKYKQSFGSVVFNKMVVAANSQAEVDTAITLVKNYAENMTLPDVENANDSSSEWQRYTTFQERALYTSIAKNKVSWWKDGVEDSGGYRIRYDSTVGDYYTKDFPLAGYYEKCIYIEAWMNRASDSYFMRY